jgi:hypothetical protein
MGLSEIGSVRNARYAAARLFNKNMQIETAKLRFADFGNSP